MSLGSGITFGTLIGYGAYRISANPKDVLFLLSRLIGSVCYCFQYVPNFWHHELCFTYKCNHQLTVIQIHGCNFSFLFNLVTLF